MTDATGPWSGPHKTADGRQVCRYNAEHIMAGAPATTTIYGGEVIGFTEACDECVAVHQRLTGGHQT